MDDSPLVTIIVPVYNGADYMCQAIDSALSQSYSPLEVIVVNDGSDDQGRTREAAKGYGDRICYVEKQNGGVSSALNAGLARARGEYVSWLSHDDLYSPYKIERQVEQLTGVQGKFISCCAFNIIDHAGRELGQVAAPVFEYEYQVFDLIASQSLNGCALLLPRKAFEEVGMFREELRNVQDYDMWIRIAAEYRFLPLADSLVSFRRHAHQGSRQSNHVGEVLEFFGKQVAALPRQELEKLTPAGQFELLKRFYTHFAFKDSAGVVVGQVSRLAEEILDEADYAAYEAYTGRRRILQKTVRRIRDSVPLGLANAVRTVLRKISPGSSG